MAYSDFTLDSVCRAFSLELNDQVALFPAIVSRFGSAKAYCAVLDESFPLAISIHTEKARSEFIVGPDSPRSAKLMKHTD